MHKPPFHALLTMLRRNRPPIYPQITGDNGRVIHMALVAEPNRLTVRLLPVMWSGRSAVTPRNGRVRYRQSWPFATLRRSSYAVVERKAFLMNKSGILADVIAEITSILGLELGTVCVTCAVVGLYFTGVALDLDTAGTCATPARAEMHAACCPTTSNTVLPPGTLRGRRALDLLEN
jgi:hypothetical protein